MFHVKNNHFLPVTPLSHSITHKNKYMYILFQSIFCHQCQSTTLDFQQSSQHELSPPQCIFHLQLSHSCHSYRTPSPSKLQVPLTCLPNGTNEPTLSCLSFRLSFSFFFSSAMNSVKRLSLSFIFSMPLNRSSFPYFMANSLKVDLREDYL